jgi:hypothetical protein
VIRLGVYRSEQYPPAWYRRDHIDYRLLRTGRSPSEQEIRMFEEITRDMQLIGGVFRTSRGGRFRDLDLWLREILTKNFTSGTELCVQDWAAADCLTSAEWHASLRNAFPKASLTASDLSLYLIEMIIPGSGSYVIEPRVGALQYVRSPLVLRMHPREPFRFPVNRWLASTARARFERIRKESSPDPVLVEFPQGVDEVRRPPYVFRKISLVHPRAAQLELQEGSFQIERHSVFEPGRASAHLIRTMNVLNLDYFSEERIVTASRSVWRTMRPAGLWVVGRSVNFDPPLHHASVLVKIADGFELLERFNQGSEVEDLALAIRM